MPPEERYKIEHGGGDVIVNLVDAVCGTETVTITDKQTGNSVTASGGSRAQAEKNAWDKLEKKQGPTPSKSGG